jgi:hypothetical protein
MKARDRVIGIGIGVLLGIGIVTAFVFWGSEQTIDAPRLEGASKQNGSKQKQPKGHGGQSGSHTPPVATVQVIGGAPPASGPAHLDYSKDDRVRIRISSDAAVGLELLGYGISTDVPGGKPTALNFLATKPGNFPLIVTASHIAVAQIRVD